MNTTVQSLQELYVKLGGLLTDTYENIADGIPVSNYVTIPDMIEACSKLAVPAELPSVTVEDDGDVLTVVDGIWNKATPGGGNSPLVVTLAYDPEHGAFSLDKTFSEIYDAANNETPVIIKTSGTFVRTAELISFALIGEEYSFNIIQTNDDGANVAYTATGTADEYPLLTNVDPPEGDVFVIIGSAESQQPSDFGAINYETQVTFQDVYNALENGKAIQIRLKLTNGDGYDYYYNCNLWQCNFNYDTKFISMGYAQTNYQSLSAIPYWEASGNMSDDITFVAQVTGS